MAKVNVAEVNMAEVNMTKVWVRSLLDGLEEVLEVALEILNPLAIAKSHLETITPEVAHTYKVDTPPENIVTSGAKPKQICRF